MIQLLADHIISPLGNGTKANLDAVLRGDSGLRLHNDAHGEMLQEPFYGSLFDTLPQREGFTPFEALCIEAAEPAIQAAGIDVTSPDCIFVLSTTKGNIWSSPALSAQKIAAYFGNHTRPVAVSTACTSGVSAQLTAFRLLRNGACKTAVVVGCDIQCRFIISGFQSFKALSPEPCRPFDAERQGLNVGEAAAAIVLAAVDKPSHDADSSWFLLGGSVHNDANHISGPSRTGEGSLRCLNDALRLLPKRDADALPSDSLACLSVHGTGTLYNDEMEAIAIRRAGLAETPVYGLKANFGHTMGAAGLMETILAVHALDRGLILPTKGYSRQGTTDALNLSPEVRTTDKTAFIKLLSGFGGVNAAVAWSRGADNLHIPCPDTPEIQTINEIHITSSDDLLARFRALTLPYPKFFRMDILCRLGFVAVEELLHDHGDCIDAEHTAVILANRSASLQNDTEYRTTICNLDNYYPSPALFVYTLPNIVTGELAIRHHLYGETIFYILDKESDLQPIIDATLRAPHITSAIVGWVECSSKTDYEAHLKLVTKQTNHMTDKNELKTLIINALNLEGMQPEDIDDAAPLFGEGLGLDSIDALELLMILDKHYGIKFANREESKAVLASINTMAEYIDNHRN